MESIRCFVALGEAGRRFGNLLAAAATTNTATDVANDAATDAATGSFCSEFI